MYKRIVAILLAAGMVCSAFADVTLGVVQEHWISVDPGDTAWAYSYNFTAPGNSDWVGPKVADFYAGVLHYTGHWIGLFTYEANAGEYQQVLFVYRNLTT